MYFGIRQLDRGYLPKISLFLLLLSNQIVFYQGGCGRFESKISEVASLSVNLSTQQDVGC